MSVLFTHGTAQVLADAVNKLPQKLSLMWPSSYVLTT